MIRTSYVALLALLSLPASSLAQTATPPPASPGAAQSPEAGQPFVRYYGPLDIGGGDQTWSITQGRDGAMYFATNRAVLEYDGSRWQRFGVGAGATTRAVAMDADNRLWYGAAADFGYFTADASGTLKPVSLAGHVPKDVAFGDVWRVFVTDTGIVFQSERAIFRWANETLTVIRPASRFSRASMVDGRIFVATPESGLTMLKGDHVEPVPGTMALATEPFPIVLKYDDHHLLLGTRAGAFVLHDGTSAMPFPLSFGGQLGQAYVYRAASLPDGSFAIGTIGAGLFVFGHDGRLRRHLDARNGLNDSTIYFITSDREGALWLGLAQGVARVDMTSALTHFDEPGVQRLRRIGGRLYAALGVGAAYLRPAAPDGSSPAAFVKLLPASGQCWDFASRSDPATPSNTSTILGCTTTLWEVRGDQLVPTLHHDDLSFRPSAFTESKIDPTRVWVGQFDGLSSLRWVGGRWIDEGRIDGIGEQLRTLVESADGTLWAGTQSQGALRVRFASPPVAGVPRPAASVDTYGTKDGLPAGGIAIIAVDGLPLFSGGLEDNQIFAFDTAARRFVRQTDFDNVVAVNPAAGGFFETDGHAVYANAGRETAVFTKQAGGHWSSEKSTFQPLGRALLSGLVADPPGVVWLASGDGQLIRFDMSLARSQPTPFPVSISRVTGTDSRLLFDLRGSTRPPLSLASTSNSLRFEYAAQTYLDEEGPEYQTRLDGFDTEWSAWSHQAFREYTNLGAGSYTFRVKARNSAAAGAAEAPFAFAILPPWYRTWWAYAAYALLAGLGLLTLTRVTRGRAVARERQRSQLTEAKLRADAAESLAQTEREGKKNVELLSEIGREITSSLEIETIFGKLYEHVNQLADADVFGVGLYRPDRHEIEYRLAIENGKRYAPYTRDTTDPNQLPVWCIDHREPVFINDVVAEHGRYIASYRENSQALEDGSMSQQPQSLIYLPLVSKDRVLGVITIQSLRKNAYTPHHLNVMRSLASYTAIALDNADAYRQLNEHEHEIRRLFEEAQKARAVAEEADAAKSAFLSTVSHELRTPLTSVLGFAKIIKKRLEDRIFPMITNPEPRVAQTIRQVDDNLGVVISEGERLTKLIDDVLDLAKIEAGKLEWHMEPVSVAEVVERATTATASLFEQKGLRLASEVAPGLPAIVGDRDRLIQVVINLVSNAVKFTPAGTITCRAARRGGNIVVSITDTGVGIAPADQPKVFERFKQVGDTLTDKPKGTGLGLPICREIVDHHGGRIWVESVPGQGSTFSFSLPLPAAAAADASTPVELAALIRQFRDEVLVSTPQSGERQSRILVVDDDPNIRELLTQELTDAGYQVLSAANGREALTVVRRERPDLVVLDVMMPEMNGFDVAAVLKNDPQTMDIPIVILSIVQDRERGFRLGIDRYLTKPIDTDLLFREVGALIEQKKSHKRVMVVDEDASTVKTLTDVLTARGYTVVEARGGDLIQRAVASQPDIILLNALSPAQADAVRLLRFEKGMEHVLFLVYQ
ncbi:MAG TPA: ATP-binding protein [Vicinamibacterales bacterium]|jgi:signal transduction histidine kinase/CheY-like chemotaxis protein